MRVALVSPYSWTYPGGVNRHVEALAGELTATGHDVRVLAPFDPCTRRAAIAHRGAWPQERPVPEYLMPLGGSIGVPNNGAVTNAAGTPAAVAKLRHALRTGGFDVIHLHEPVCPVIGWDALTSAPAGTPLVGTFHCYSEAAIPHGIANLLGARRKLNHLHARIAVSEAAAWTGRRFYGGEYAIVPNGVDLPAGGIPTPSRRREQDPLRIAFVGQAVERKGLPVLLRAFEALREEVRAELVIVGATEEEVAPLLHDRAGISVLGRVGDDLKHATLVEADVLCAPSLGGESFGMVLTEAFAAGTAVVASDIAGYRDVVSHGTDGLLVPRGDARALAETLRDLAHDTERTAALGTRAAASADRYAWPRVAREIEAVYDAAIAAAAATAAEAGRNNVHYDGNFGPVVGEGRLQQAARRAGVLPAAGERISPRKLPSLDPEPVGRGRRRRARRAGLAAGGVGTVVLGGLAIDRIGVASVTDALLSSSPSWVLLALALMGFSMVLRSVAWAAILRSALPEARPRFADAMAGTSIGVLMSATLPARLGEPSRALIVARRLGRARDAFPVVLGTIVSQTILNLVALVILGAVMFATVGLFAGRQQALVWYALGPFVGLCAVLVAPALLRPDSRIRGLAIIRGALARVRTGLAVFRHPRHGLIATAFQLTAWAVQWLSCYVLLVALGLDHRAGIGAAAAVLFAVNVTAVLPLTPSNVGVFQAACATVLTAGYGVGAADALGYGIVLQAVEVAVAVAMGAPALVKEGLSWREVRVRALHAAPVSLTPRRGAVEDVA